MAKISQSTLASPNVCTPPAFPTHEGGQLSSVPKPNSADKPTLTKPDKDELKKSALISSTILSSLASKPDNKVDKFLDIWAEKMKAEKERTKTLQKLKDAIQKIDSEIHKSRSDTANKLNQEMLKLLKGN